MPLCGVLTQRPQTYLEFSRPALQYVSNGHDLLSVPDDTRQHEAFDQLTILKMFRGTYLMSPQDLLRVAKQVHVRYTRKWPRVFCGELCRSSDDGPCAVAVLPLGLQPVRILLAELL